ncbi:MAG: hypothetical protein ABF276_07940 [Sulfurovum sp.]
MKKTTLMMIASVSMLFAVPPVDSTPMQGQGMKQGQGMMQGQGMKQMKQRNKACNKKNMMQRKMYSPVLIKHGLPHMNRMIMTHLNDPTFALSEEQKLKLDTVRSESMGTMMKIRPEVMALKNDIVNASLSGTSTLALKEKVLKLASLKAEATMVQLKCIEMIKNILTKDQLVFLLAHKNRGMNYGQKGMRENKCRSNCRNN